MKMAVLHSIFLCLDLIVELEGVQQIVEAVEVGLLEVISNDRDHTPIVLTAAQVSFAGSDVKQLANAVLLPWNWLSEGVVERHVERVADAGIQLHQINQQRHLLHRCFFVLFRHNFAKRRTVECTVYRAFEELNLTAFESLPLHAIITA